MKNAKTTRRALGSSILALILCFTMLLGTTYAWFTDTATNAGNRIIAGKLEVDLQMWKATNGYETIADETGSIFKETDKDWEPGKTKVAYLAVANKGNLELKYDFAMKVQDLGLVDALEYTTVAWNRSTGEVSEDSLENAVWTDLKSGANSIQVGDLVENEIDYIALAVRMKTDAGNEYQEKSVVVDVVVLATQTGNDYDADATMPADPLPTRLTVTETVTVDAEQKTTEETTIKSDNTDKATTVVIPAGVKLDATASTDANVTVSVEPEDEVNSNVQAVVADGQEAVTLEINVPVASDNNVPVAVTVNIGAGLNNVVVYHEANPMQVSNDPAVEGYNYNATSGVLTIYSKTFSPFTYVHTVSNGVTVKTADELAGALVAGGTITLANDITISNILNVVKDTVIDGKGYTLTYTGSGAGARAIDVKKETNGADLTVKNLTIDCTASYCQRGINYNTSGVLTLDNVTVSGENVTYAVNLPGSAISATVEISNSSLTGNIALNIWGKESKITVVDSVLTSIDTADHEGYAAIALNSETGNAADGTVVTITGGKVIAKDEKGAPSLAVRDYTKGSTVKVTDTTEVVGEIYQQEIVAKVAYVKNNGEYYNEFYGFATFEDALAKAEEDAKNGVKNAVIVLQKDVVLSETITISENVVLDLNGFDFTAETGSRPFHVYGADLTIIATGSNVELDKYGLVDIKEGDVKISIIGGTFTGELDNGAVIKGRKNTEAEIYLENVTMTFTDIAGGSYIYNPEESASATTVIEGGLYNIDCGSVGDVTMKNATVNVKGFVFNGGGLIENCTITTDGSSKAPFDAAPFCCVAASNDRTVTVKNSTLTATNCNAIEIYPTGGEVIVTDSIVTGECYKHPLYDAQYKCSITIDGVEQ